MDSWVSESESELESTDNLKRNKAGPRSGREREDRTGLSAPQTGRIKRAGKEFEAGERLSASERIAIYTTQTFFVGPSPCAKESHDGQDPITITSQWIPLAVEAFP